MCGEESNAGTARAPRPRSARRNCSGPKVIETELGVWLQGVGIGATFGAGIAVNVGSGAAYGVAGVGVFLLVVGYLLDRENPVERPDG